MGVTQYREQAKHQQIVTQHASYPLERAVGVAWAQRAKRMTLTKVRGSSPERWEVEIIYDVKVSD